MAQQGFDLNAILKKAQALQQSFEANKAKLKQETATAQVGGGMVSATVDGEKVVKEIKIAPELVQDGDVSAIEDLVVSAVMPPTLKSTKKFRLTCRHSRAMRSAGWTWATWATLSANSWAVLRKRKIS